MKKWKHSDTQKIHHIPELIWEMRQNVSVGPKSQFGEIVSKCLLSEGTYRLFMRIGKNWKHRYSSIH